jgi:hypothetical protein
VRVAEWGGHLRRRFPAVTVALAAVTVYGPRQRPVRFGCSLKWARRHSRQTEQVAECPRREGAHLPPTSLPLVPEARSTILKVVLTPDEKERLRARAAAERRSVSEYVRLRLPLSDSATPTVNGNPLPPPEQVVMTRAA